MELRESIYVIGEGQTEKYYFKHLKQLKSYRCNIRPRFFSSQNSIYHIEKKTEELLQAGVIVICAFDADVPQRNKSERDRLRSFIQRYKENQQVIICDSLPSIEFWFLLHFKKTNRYFQNYNAIKTELRKYLPDYDKSEKYLSRDNWIKVLIERQEMAIDNAKRIEAPPTASYSNIYRAIELLETRV